MGRSWRPFGKGYRGTAGEVWLLSEPHVATAKNRVVGQAVLVGADKVNQRG